MVTRWKGAAYGLEAGRCGSTTPRAFGVRVPLEDVTIENFVSVDAIEAYLGRAHEGGSS